MSKFIIDAAGVEAIAERKNVKYIRISVKPPDGQVFVSIPKRASLVSVRRFMEEKRDWIDEKQREMTSRAENGYFLGEDSLMLWGQRLPLKVICSAAKDKAELSDIGVVIFTVSGDRERCVEILDGMLRSQLAERLPAVVDKWETAMGVRAEQWRSRRMKTRWGSCNTTRRRIWLNLRLAMLPPECLEYVVVHELCHLHEPSHNARFKALMDGYLPGWRETRQRMASMSGVLYIE